MRLLVVDDEPDFLNVLVEFFRDRGDEVSTAENGRQAWAIYRESPDNFDAILIDNRMPEMSGIDCIKQIRKNGFLVPIILASGDWEADHDKAIIDEVFEILSKPLKLATLDSVFSRLESSLTK